MCYGNMFVFFSVSSYSATLYVHGGEDTANEQMNMAANMFISALVLYLCQHGYSTYLHFLFSDTHIIALDTQT